MTNPMNSDFFQEHKKEVIIGGVVTAGGITAAVLAPTYAAKAAALMVTGCLLGLGFWAGKQITNKLDEIRCLCDKELMDSLKADKIVQETTQS